MGRILVLNSYADPPPPSLSEILYQPLLCHKRCADDVPIFKLTLAALMTFSYHLHEI